jgi:hypothetical protein
MTMGPPTQYELVQAHIPYQQVFKLAPPKRKLWSSWFVEQVDLKIEIVDPNDAPIAYEVRFGPEDSPRQCGYPIRSYQNDLWWPVGGDYNYILHPETFARMLKDGHPETLILLDPSFAGSIEQRPLHTFPKDYRHVDHDWNNLVNQQAIAQRGASTTIFCGDGTFVRGGEPLFYALPYGADGDKNITMAVGISDTKRQPDGTSRSEPGPERSARMSAARRGFAFSIGEIDEAMRDLEARGYTVYRRNAVDVLIDRHVPNAAPLMCARALAQSLVAVPEEDRRRERLHAEIPVIAHAASEDEVADQWNDVLHRLCSSNDPIVAYGFPAERRAAKAILQRLGVDPSSGFSPDDDDALGRLGPG